MLEASSWALQQRCVLCAALTCRVSLPALTDLQVFGGKVGLRSPPLAALVAELLQPVGSSCCALWAESEGSQNRVLGCFHVLGCKPGVHACVQCIAWQAVSLTGFGPLRVAPLQATEDERQLLCSAPADSLVGLVHCRLLEVVSHVFPLFLFTIASLLMPYCWVLLLLHRCLLRLLLMAGILASAASHCLVAGCSRLPGLIKFSWGCPAFRGSSTQCCPLHPAFRSSPCRRCGRTGM